MKTDDINRVYRKWVIKTMTPHPDREQREPITPASAPDKWATASGPHSVWLVWAGEYEQRGILKAFEHEGDARRYMAHQATSPYPDGYELEELVLDDPNFPLGAWRFSIQAEPRIGGWGESLCWHSGVNEDEPSSCRGPILSPKDGSAIVGAMWEAYGKTPEIAKERAFAFRSTTEQP